MADSWEYDSTEGLDLPEMIAMGRKGWELVQVITQTSPWTLVWKRPVQDDA
jgi:hypothetical protein